MINEDEENPSWPSFLIHLETRPLIMFAGRSSIEDQTEAVRVGIDLFMTKPVALKEVGKIIDNWAANRESEEMDIDGNGGSG